MEDTQNLKVSEKNWNGAYVAKHTALLIKAGIEDGSAPFLPQNGRLSPQAIINANTGYVLNAKDLIPVQLVRQEKGYASLAVGTFATMGKAGTRTREGEKGMYFNFKGSDGEFHHSAYFFAEQTEHPERLSEYARRNDRQPRRLSEETLRINSAEEYLPVYLAACRSGAGAEVSAEIAGQFKERLLALCDNELARRGERNPTLPRLNEMLYQADRKATEIVREAERRRGVVPDRTEDRRPVRETER